MSGFTDLIFDNYCEYPHQYRAKEASTSQCFFVSHGYWANSGLRIQRSAEEQFVSQRMCLRCIEQAACQLVFPRR